MGAFWVLFCVGMTAFMAFMFGFFIKTTDEYDCALQIVQHSSEVVQAIGEPVEPGLIAWLNYWESEGSAFQTYFRTAVSGPRGDGSIGVEIYRTPIDSSMIIEYEGEGGSRVVYSGPYHCPR